MAKYLFVYHGGAMAETPEAQQQSMEAWGRWAGELGPAVVDFGAPVSATTTVGGETADPVSGYSLISADSLEAASELAKGCPILSSGGRVEIGETVDMSGAA